MTTHPRENPMQSEQQERPQYRFEIFLVANLSRTVGPCFYCGERYALLDPQPVLGVFDVSDGSLEEQADVCPRCFDSLAEGGGDQLADHLELLRDAENRSRLADIAGLRREVPPIRWDGRTAAGLSGYGHDAPACEQIDHGPR
jgi:hypothetical protein